MLVERFHAHRPAADKFYNLRVAYPVWRRNYDLISGIADCLQGVEDRVFRPSRNKDLRRVKVEVIVALEFVHDRLQEFRYPFVRGVMRKILLDGADR